MQFVLKFARLESGVRICSLYVKFPRWRHESEAIVETKKKKKKNSPKRREWILERVVRWIGSLMFC